MSAAPEQIARLSERARAVAEQHRGVYLSFEEEAHANAALMRTALLAVAPAIDALATNLKGWGDVRGVAVGTAPAGSVPDVVGRVLYACPGRGADVVLVEGLLRGGEVVSLEPVDVTAAAGRYRAEHVLACLLRKCDEQLGGNARRRSEQARARAERIRALLVLVEALLG